MKIALVKEMQQMDKLAVERYGIPEILLMENAGLAACRAMAEALEGLPGKTICVLAGSGNNGGDAFAAIRHMANQGARIKAFLVGSAAHLKPSAAMNRDICLKMGVEVQALEAERDWDKVQLVLRFADGVLDGILGTGFNGPLRESVERLIGLVNASGRPVVAIDVPSGVNADTGAVASDAVRAAVTVALGLPKPGLLLCPGASYVGRLVVDGIGMPAALLADKGIQQDYLDRELAAALLPARARDVHKGSVGRVLVVAGSRGMTGAAVLASRAVLRAGAGIATLSVAESLHDILEVKLTEVMTRPMPETEPGVLGLAALDELTLLSMEYDVLLLGPGIGRAEETGKLVRQLAAAAECQLVLDADALYAYRGHTEELKSLHQPPVLTPHLGELAGLLAIPVAELRADLLARCRRAARDWNAVLAVKSECTAVVYPDGRAYFTSTGNPGMATAGAGDVLAGTIAGLWKQALPGTAPLAGVYLHGLAGDLAAAYKAEGLIAGDILEHLPKARRTLQAH